MAIDMTVAACGARHRAAAHLRVKPGIFMLCALLLTACGKEGPAKGAATTRPVASTAKNTPDPCAVLTRGDIAVALGMQLEQAVHEHVPRPNCRYKVGDGSVIVYVFADSSAKGSYTAGKTVQAAYSTAVPGIGNDAYWAPDLKVLNVLKGNVYFTVQFLGLGSASLEAAKQLARNAADRLP